MHAPTLRQAATAANPTHRQATHANHGLAPNMFAHKANREATTDHPQQAVRVKAQDTTETVHHHREVQAPAPATTEAARRQVLAAAVQAVATQAVATQAGADQAAEADTLAAVVEADQEVAAEEDNPTATFT